MARARRTFTPEFKLQMVRTAIGYSSSSNIPWIIAEWAGLKNALIILLIKIKIKDLKSNDKTISNEQIPHSQSQFWMIFCLSKLSAKTPTNIKTKIIGRAINNSTYVAREGISVNSFKKKNIIAVKPIVPPNWEVKFAKNNFEYIGFLNNNIIFFMFSSSLNYFRNNK